MGDFDAEGVTQISARAFLGGDRILVADADMYRRAWLREALGTYVVEEVDTARDALSRLSADPPRILVVGPRLADATAEAMLDAAVRHGLVRAHGGGPVVFLLGDAADGIAQVDEQTVPVFYRLTPTLAADRVSELVTNALARTRPKRAQRAQSEGGIARTRQLVDHTKKLSEQRDVKAAATAAMAAVVDLARADRARCVFYDDDSGELWAAGEGDGLEARASAGIAGFVARAGSPVMLERAADDPAYTPGVDDPAGSGEERLLLQPVTDRRQRIHAVLIAIREPANAPFTPRDASELAALAAAWAPFIEQLAVETELADAHTGGDGMFRREAVENMLRRGVKGDVVRVHPAWINAAFWVVLLAVGASVAFATVAEVHQYTEGPSVVRVTGRTDLVAYDGGSVTGVEVSAGQQVTAGQVLIRLHDTEQANRMRGLEAEFERKLVAYLQSPADPAVRQALSALVAERESGKANLEARVIRAPHDGVVRDVLVNVGQRVDPGKIVVAVARADVPEGLSVLAFLAGADRPRLRPGQPLRLVLPGYRGAVVRAKVRAISSDAIGAAEAKARYLGDRLGDSIQLKGTVVVVEAQLPATFEADGHRYELHDGMVGTSEVRLESRSVLETAIGITE